MPNYAWVRPHVKASSTHWQTHLVRRTQLSYTFWRNAVNGAIIRKIGAVAAVELIPTLPLIQHFREGLTPAEAATICTGVSGHGLSEAERLSVQGKLTETKE